MKTAIRPDTCVRQVIERWPATRAVFQSYAIPTETAAHPAWETIEGAAAARGYWAADRLMSELIQATGVRAKLRLDTSLVELVRTYPTAAAVLERYSIHPSAESIASWESIEQAAAARGQWAVDGLLEELNAAREALEGDDRKRETINTPS
jgi:hypothetical protein